MTNFGTAYRLLGTLALGILLPGNTPVKLTSNEMPNNAQQLVADQSTTITSTLKRDPMQAVVTLSKNEQRISSIKMTHDGVDLLLPDSAFTSLKGAQLAWLEKRGALPTLIIAGEEAGTQWKLALIFHPKQLWKRRLSIEGLRRDEFTFYDRDDMEPSEPERRRTMSMGVFR
jgi:hypothetical protein